MTSTETESMVHFARMRLQEELVLVANAQPGLLAEAAPGGIAMALYDSYLRRKELAVSREIVRKLVLIEEESMRAEQAEQQNAPAYTLPYLKNLLRRWRDHPEYNPAWAAPPE